MGKCTTIGVLSPLLGGFYFGSLLTGINKLAQSHGAQVIALQTLEAWVAHSEHATPISDYPLAWDHVDGWIVVLKAAALDYLKEIQRSGKPLVTLSSVIPELACPAVLPDNVGGTAAAVRHLLEHGHRRIAFAGFMDQEDILHRYEGYRSVLREQGLEPDPALLFEAHDNMVDAGRVVGQRLVDAGLPCSAIVAGTDGNAIGLMEVVQAAGYRIPEDLAIIGFDDIAAAQQTTPSLTSVRQRFDALGGAAAELLLERIAGRPVSAEPRYVATSLIQRQSCGCSLTTPGAPAVSGDDYLHPGWQARLGQRLVETALYPIAPDPGLRPEQVWPGVLHVLNALQAALGEGEPPSIAEQTQAWREAVVLVPQIETLHKTINTLRLAGGARLAQRAQDPDARARLDAFLDQTGLNMALARLGVETARGSYLERAVQHNYEINYRVLGSEAKRVRDLAWLSWTPVRKGCLSLWQKPIGRDHLELCVVGAYSQDGDAMPALGFSCAPEQFPPPELLSSGPRTASADIVSLMPIRTENRDWGVLAVLGPIETQLSTGRETTAQWAALLGVALDREELVSSLEEQQNTLRRAYERERSLAGTVRELGSPVIPLLPGVLLVPLVGAIDVQRAQQMLEVVLDGIGKHNASVVLLDITGVPLVDTAIANSLIQATKAATLLGARVILVGVRPEIAQSIVGLGINLQHMQTQPTLAAAIESILQSQRFL